MKASEAKEKYESHISQTYGGEFAATVQRFQDGFLNDGVCKDADRAFSKAVETALRLLSVIKIKSAQ